MTIKLTTLAARNIEKVKMLSSEQTEIRETMEKDIYNLKWNIYHQQIRALEEERDEKIGELQMQAEAIIKQKNERIIELNEPVLQVKRILEFLRLDQKQSVTIKDDDINAYRGDYKESVGYLFKDKYLNAKLFIIGNGKPKNKYSLVVYGKCLFTEELLKLHYSYGVPGHTHERYQLVVNLRDFPAVSEAKAWLEKNKEKLDLFEEYKAVKQEYLEAKAQYKLRQFKDFIFIKCSCGYFYTTFEKDSYSSRYWDNPTCPRCSASLKQTN